MSHFDDNTKPTSVMLDVQEFDLSSLVGMQGSVLESIAREVREEADEDPQARHSSHSSYSSHSNSPW
jgi:hypothetical protein